MTTSATHGKNAKRPLNILVLINPLHLYINTIRDSCEAFDLYSEHHYTYASAHKTKDPVGAIAPDYSGFDVLMIHYSVRVAFWDWIIDDRVIDAIRAFTGYKILFIQDEYDRTAVTRERIRYLGINRVFTCVPAPFIERVYPPDECPGTEFTTILTGYIPPSLEMGHSTPLEDRPYSIVYRGRSMSYVYGDLGREKIDIGKTVKAACEEKGIPVDIEWTEDKRIYKEEWSKFLLSGRATLGTESGCNVFDMDGSLRTQIENALQEDPDLTYEQAKAKFFEEENIGVRMNQISPKFFEFIASRTALILYEGEYSGILKENVHYLSLKKDGSNLDSILEAIEDLDLLKNLTDNAYRDLVEGREYSFQAFAQFVDRSLGSIQPAAGSGETSTGSSGPSLVPPPTYTSLYQHALLPDRIPALKGDAGEPEPGSVQFLKSKIENFRGMISRRKEKIEKLQQSAKG